MTITKREACGVLDDVGIDPNEYEDLRWNGDDSDLELTAVDDYICFEVDEKGSEPSSKWWSDREFQNKDIDISDFKEDAIEEVTSSKEKYKAMIKYLAILLDAGINVNSISRSLKTTRNEDKIGESNDPCEEGYEPGI